MLKRFIYLLFAFVTLIVQSTLTAAEMKTFSTEYVYQAGKEDNRDSSRIMAIREVKRILMMELAVTLENEKEAKGLNMAQDQLMALASGIVLIDIADEKWDSHAFGLKSKFSVDPAAVFKSIDAIRIDPDQVKELEDSWKKSEDLLRSAKELRNGLLTADGKKGVQDGEAYRKIIKELMMIDYMERGYAEANRGRQEQAIQDFGKVIELDAKNFWAHYNKGIAHGQLRRFPLAVQDFDRAVAINPRYAPVLVKRGLASFRLGQHDQAIQDFNRAIEVDQKLIMAYNSRGIVNANRGRFDEAIQDFDRSLEMSPRFLAAYLNRGLAYFNQSKYERAIEDFSKATELDPRVTVTYIYTGLSYFNLGRIDQAITAYEKAIKQDPKLSAAYYHLARLYTRQGDTQKAMENLKKVVNLNPDLRTKIKADRDFEKISGQPDFIELIGKK